MLPSLPRSLEILGRLPGLGSSPPIRDSDETARLDPLRLRAPSAYSDLAGVPVPNLAKVALAWRAFGATVEWQWRLCDLI